MNTYRMTEQTPEFCQLPRVLQATYTHQSMEVEDEFVQDNSVTIQFSNPSQGVRVQVLDSIEHVQPSCNTCDTMKTSNIKLAEEKKQLSEMVDFWKSLALTTCETANELNDINNTLTAENQALKV